VALLLSEKLVDHPMCLLVIGRLYRWSTNNSLIDDIQQINITFNWRHFIYTPIRYRKADIQSISDNDVRKILLEKPRFELAAKGLYSDWEDEHLHPPAGRSSLWAWNGESSTATDGWHWHRKESLGACMVHKLIERSDRLPVRLDRGTAVHKFILAKRIIQVVDQVQLI